MSRSPFESKRTRKRSRRLIADFVSPDDDDDEFEPYLIPKMTKSSPSVRRSSRSQAQKSTQSSPSKSVAAAGRKLRNILGLPKAYLWCCYEWFYSDIDQAIFGGEGDFRLYLKEAFPTLQTRKLTRCQWAQIRRLMGKPRRCSALFFQEERHALEKQRSKIRLLQRREVSEMDWNHFKDIPQEIPPHLILGTTVTACLHSEKHGRLYTGQIEAVDLTKGQYHINFLQPGIESCWVSDIDVMSCSPQEMMPISSFLQHPRRGLSWSSNISSLPPPVRISTPVASQSVLLKSDPIVGAASIGSGNGDTLGGFPIRFLRLVIQLSKILSIKKNNIQRLTEMNTQAEKLSSFDEPIPPELQAQCASIVLHLDKLNRELKITLQDIDEFMRQFDTKENGSGDGDGANSKPRQSIKELSDQEAKDLTRSLNEKENGSAQVTSECIVDLVSSLASLLYQFKHLGENEAIDSGDLQALEDSMRPVKMNSANSKLFENQVEVHLSHIQTGLTRLGNLNAFSKIV